MGELRSIDFVVGAILGVAALRGLFRGLTREAISIASLAAACVVVRLFAAPSAEWLVETSNGQVGPLAAPRRLADGFANRASCEAHQKKHAKTRRLEPCVCK